MNPLCLLLPSETGPAKKKPILGGVDPKRVPVKMSIKPPK